MRSFGNHGISVSPILTPSLTCSLTHSLALSLSCACVCAHSVHAEPWRSQRARRSRSGRRCWTRLTRTSSEPTPHHATASSSAYVDARRGSAHHARSHMRAPTFALLHSRSHCTLPQSCSRIRAPTFALPHSRSRIRAPTLAPETPAPRPVRTCTRRSLRLRLRLRLAWRSGPEARGVRKASRRARPRACR